MGVGPPGGGQGKQPANVETEVDRAVSPELLEDERAEEDGERIAELEAELAALRVELAASRADAARADRRASIERELTAAGAIDLEITTPLVEQVVSAMDTPEVRKAVRQVVRDKPFLFRSLPGGGVSSEAMAGERASGGASLEEMASEARSSGDRGDLLRYLRARRG